MRRLFLFILAVCFVLSSCAGPGHYKPSSGRGPVILMLSGKTGPGLYKTCALRLADSGYYVLLFDGNDFPINQTDLCQAKIRTIIKDNIPSSFDLSGQAAVIGYSLGGAAALTCAAGMKGEIAAVIAYYPATSMIADHDACVERFNVPVTVLQGEEDRYFDCCRIEVIRQMSAKAVREGRDVQLFVYPQAGHGFNLGPMKDKELDRDSWHKTLETLKKHLLRQQTF